MTTNLSELNGSGSGSGRGSGNDTGCSTSFKSSKSHSGSTLNYSIDINAISVDLAADNSEEVISCSGLKYLPAWPAINLEFSDLTCTVPGKDDKTILHSISGQFRSHELTAIMGPSGSGKTTLLNLLAGCGAQKTSGQISVNRRARDMHLFRKMSRYIMQNDIVDPHFTVLETMMLAANLKLGLTLSMDQKREVIEELLCMLRLKSAENTKALRLSGGERKRLCIALELVNNPAVVFLDEPTTGLDDLSSSLCVSLLRRLAHAGRTIICSIHTPSAKIFAMFDQVYVLAEGQCIYQGRGANIVPYIEHIGLKCPVTYNPADFIIEVACREYGNDFHDTMVAAVRNGKVPRWTSESEYGREKAASPSKSDTTSGASSCDEMDQFEEEINPALLCAKSSWWLQYRLLVGRMLTQMWRDKFYMKLRFYMNIGLALIVGGIYRGVGEDATKALFNFGFSFNVVIAYLYLPMMPVLLQFPSQISFLKREYMNQWYHLSSYYAAMTCAKLPFMLLLTVIYLTMVYVMSSQPLELFRFAMFFAISFLTSMTSESWGLLISSRLSLVNAMFMGPVLSVPLILFAVYTFGYGKDAYIPPIMRVLMSTSYLRHGIEGLMDALYGYNRGDTICPDTEMICYLKNSKFLLTVLGFDNLNFFVSMTILFGFYTIFTLGAYILIKQRLSLDRRHNVLVQYAVDFLTKYLNFTSYHY